MERNSQADALFESAQSAYFGLNEPQDKELAAKRFLQAAWQGSAEAMCYLAGCFLFGEGVEKDVVAAADWYLRAAREKNRAARYELCRTEFADLPAVRAYRAENPTPSGVGVPALARAGNAEAQTALADMYRYGIGGKCKNVRSALKWYAAAAKQKDPQAQFSLYSMAKENKISKDALPQTMHALLKSAAEQGLRSAVKEYRLCAMLAASLSEALEELSPSELADILKEDDET